MYLSESRWERVKSKGQAAANLQNIELNFMKKSSFFEISLSEEDKQTVLLLHLGWVL